MTRFHPCDDGTKDVVKKDDWAKVDTMSELMQFSIIICCVLTRGQEHGDYKKG